MCSDRLDRLFLNANYNQTKIQYQFALEFNCEDQIKYSIST